MLGPRGGQTMAENATARMRPVWQGWHFMSPGESRRLPNLQRSGHAARAAGVAFYVLRGGQTVAKSATVEFGLKEFAFRQVSSVPQLARISLRQVSSVPKLSRSLAAAPAPKLTRTSPGQVSSVPKSRRISPGQVSSAPEFDETRLARRHPSRN